VLVWPNDEAISILEYAIAPEASASQGPQSTREPYLPAPGRYRDAITYSDVSSRCDGGGRDRALRAAAPAQFGEFEKPASAARSAARNPSSTWRTAGASAQRPEDSREASRGLAKAGYEGFALQFFCRAGRRVGQVLDP
jgi:hypothetical protein